MADPMIGFWRWFYSNGDANDWLALRVSNDNGATGVSVDTTRGLHNEWQEQSLRIADHVTPTSQVKIRLVAADLGPASIVEAGIDDSVAYDAASVQVSVYEDRLPAPPLAFRAPQPQPRTRGADAIATGATHRAATGRGGRSGGPPRPNPSPWSCEGGNPGASLGRLRRGRACRRRGHLPCSRGRRLRA